MTLLEYDDPQDHRLARGATGLLAEFNQAGALEAADVHVASRLTSLAGEHDEKVALAVAVAVRALRGGSVCVDLTRIAEDGDGLPWPEPTAWIAAIQASPLASSPEVLRLLDDRLLYFDRYWREEEQVANDLLARPVAETPVNDARLDRIFGDPKYVEQRAAAAIALAQRTTVLTGGPGTGKTTTVAGLLALLTERAESEGQPPLRIALAAPTGKASARLQQAVVGEIAYLPPEDQRRLAGLAPAMTLHRLLGSRPDTSSRFRHHRDNRLPHDVIVVDETSMVSLTMMARLLEAVRPESRLILVGDPNQLASIEAGAVLADLVEVLGDRDDVGLAELRTSHRFGPAINALAEAIRMGDADAALEVLRSGDEHVEFVTDPDPVPRLRSILLPHALGLRAAAERGEATEALALLERERLLCAHREGPHGVHHWNRNLERWISEETGEGIWSSWYVGRPLLVTANDYGLNLFNGDTGVAVRAAEGGLRAVIGGTAGEVALAASRLGEVETMHAMTIHKSQGSQADQVTVLMPPEESRLLTRELLYTAVTRAKTRVRLVGTEESVRAAIERRALRASGLRQRIGG